MSYLSLLSFRTLSEGLMQVPHVQYTIPFVPICHTVGAL